MAADAAASSPPSSLLNSSKPWNSRIACCRATWPAGVSARPARCARAASTRWPPRNRPAAGSRPTARGGRPRAPLVMLPDLRDRAEQAQGHEVDARRVDRAWSMTGDSGRAFADSRRPPSPTWQFRERAVRSYSAGIESDEGQRMEALEGLKVLELGQLIAGPFAGKTLGRVRRRRHQDRAARRRRPAAQLAHAAATAPRCGGRCSRATSARCALDLRSAEGQDVGARAGRARPTC